MKTLLLAALTVALAGAAVHADPDAPREQRVAQRAMRRMARFDINRDGRLEPEERIAMRSYAYARLVRRFDLNHDGRLGPGEVPPVLEQRLRRFDVNGDGWIEPGEMILPRRGPRRAR